MGEPVKKPWTSHKAEEDSALTKKAILIPSPSRVNFEDILLREISWGQKDKCYLIPPCCEPWRTPVHKQKAGRVKARGGGTGEPVLSVMG